MEIKTFTKSHCSKPVMLVEGGSLFGQL